MNTPVQNTPPHRALLLSLLVLVMSGCPPDDMPEPEPEPTDPGEVVYDGPTQGSGIPVYPRNDAGLFLYDSGLAPPPPCCTVTYRIADEEAESVTGVVQGEHAVLGEGVALDRSEGEWSAEVCIPLGASFAYWFVFTTRYEEEQDIYLIDGGVQTSNVEVALETRRASAQTTVYYDAQGAPFHIQAAAASCDELVPTDAGPPPDDAGSTGATDAGSSMSIDGGTDGGPDAGVEPVSDGGSDAGDDSVSDGGAHVDSGV